MIDDLRKADGRLRAALQQAQGTERLRAIVQIGPGPGILTAPSSLDDPSQFGTRVAWQKARVAEQKGRVAAATRSTRQALADLNVHVLGGELSGTIVIEGTADQIASSLELPGVASVSLDRALSVELGQPDE